MFLAIYLNDHLAGANAGLRLARKITRHHRGRSEHSDLEAFVRDLEADRLALCTIMDVLGMRPKRAKAAAAGLIPNLTALKPNGRWLRRSPLSDVVELEAMALGITGKMAGWESLRLVADVVGELDAPMLDTLIDRARAQRDLIEALRRRSVPAVFTPDV